ncbi:MAG TPA: RIP metalloprotease RseP [Candidatus Acidoferrum sp.]|nr:RIP metalloprotease RseP [Candidatus Acidoferrum sp.]
MKPVLVALEVLALFNLLIFVHELGHFLAARWRGLKIDRFAIWFGKPIWKTKVNGVEYALGTIPAGGYVSLPQMATMETIEGKGESSGQPLPPISALDKIIVAFAGPLFSFLLALAFAYVVMIVGRPVTEAETTTTIGYVEKDGPADKVGLKPGDKILEVDGKPVSKFGGMGDSVTWRVVRSEGPTVPVKVERDGKVLVFNPAPVKDETKFWQRKSLRQIKIGPAEAAIIAEVSPNSPAARAGLHPGDRILDVNGTPLYHFATLTDDIEEHTNATFALTVSRAGKCFTADVTPETPVSPPGEKPRIGITWDGNGITTIVHPGAIEQVRASVSAMVDTFGALFARHSDIKPQHLGGAVKIMDVYARLFSSEHGWRLALWFSVLMNVNLAVLNLLPIPVLDGGHILLAIIEAIRRKPVSARILNVVQTSCAVVIITFMVYIAFYDVQDLPWKHAKDKPTDVKFAPKGPIRN